ncbi:MAG: DUF5615 family PIN-like protein [Planctomycetes bacterium]|nr:DUF5615 family PIN-like protein [Planctomycetota bacterium]
MRFLADESVESAVVFALRAAGHDVEAVAERCPGSEDAAVLASASAEYGVLVTNDKDFASLAFLQGQASAGIVLVRLPTARSTRRGRPRHR